MGGGRDACMRDKLIVLSNWARISGSVLRAAEVFANLEFE